MKRTLPPLPEPFPPAFLAMLEQILRRAGRIQGARRETARSRHRALVQSGTFTGHRPYAVGDDLRRIDWNAVARTGQLFVKLLTEDERRATTVLVDTSRSMLAGAVPRLCTALRLAAVLGSLALLQLDGVFVQTTASAAFAGRNAMSALLEHLRAQGPQEPDLDATAEQLSRQHAPGRVHWISDFADPGAVERMLLRLRRLGFLVTGWLPVLPDDRGVPAGGWTAVVDPESFAESVVRVDAPLAAAMAHELAVLAQQQERVFANCGFPLQRLHVVDGDFTASHWLEAGWHFRR